MRVLMAVPKYPFPVAGGLERQSHALAVALVERGHVIHALSSRFDPSQADEALLDGVRIHRVKWLAFKPARFVVFPFSLGRIMLRLRRELDLVHVHNTSWFGTFVTLVAKALGLPVITKLAGNGDFGIPALRRRWFGGIPVAVLKRSDAVIAMTPESARELAAIGYPAARVLKVTNGIPVTSPATPASSGSESVRVVFVGRLSWEKGLSDLLHAWSTVQRRAVRPVKLELIGDGPLEEELRTLARMLAVEETVSFLGFCDDVARQLAGADVFVLPSYSEGNSNSVLEAMRAGLPVVATRVGGTPIQVGEEGARFLVTPGDREEIAARLLELIADVPLRRRTGAAMRERIEKVFDIRRIASTYEQAYELILRGRTEQVGDINAALFPRRETILGCAE